MLGASQSSLWDKSVQRRWMGQVSTAWMYSESVDGGHPSSRGAIGMLGTSINSWGWCSKSVDGGHPSSRGASGLMLAWRALLASRGAVASLAPWGRWEGGRLWGDISLRSGAVAWGVVAEDRCCVRVHRVPVSPIFLW